MPNTFSALYRAALSINTVFTAKYVDILDIHLTVAESGSQFPNNVSILFFYNNRGQNRIMSSHVSIYMIRYVNKPLIYFISPRSFDVLLIIGENRWPV